MQRGLIQLWFECCKKQDHEMSSLPAASSTCAAEFLGRLDILVATSIPIAVPAKHAFTTPDCSHACARGIMHAATRQTSSSSLKLMYGCAEGPPLLHANAALYFMYRDSM